MNNIQQFKIQTKKLIDDLKSVCENFGLGNDGNEFKIITQIFLYKFLNDRFIYEIKKIDKNLVNDTKWEEKLKSLSESDYEILLMKIPPNCARVKPEQFISTLHSKQNEANYSKIFDSTLVSISIDNSGIFSALTNDGQKISLFESLSDYIRSDSDAFCRSIINKLVGFSFENIYEEKFDFYSDIFEYLIKDYNSDSGGKYAEYFTPHAVSKIMAKCLVSNEVNNVTCYDPSAGSGTLLMNLAHQIGQDKCTIYSQDISQKSSSLLRLNLILNDLVHSIPNIVEGNTLLEPSHLDESGVQKKFDYIVANPPFKTDFSSYRDELDSKENKDRFFAGIPNIPKKDLSKMAIYQLFIQDILHCLKKNGKAAVVLPTGFLTAKSGIDKKIREYLIHKKILKGVISMPPNIFGTTGTKVSILFIDFENKASKISLIDASKLGTQIKIEKNLKTFLSQDDENLIIETFLEKKEVDNFSVSKSFDEIEENKYLLNAGRYFDIKIQYSELTKDEFSLKIKDFSHSLSELLHQSNDLDNKIASKLKNIDYDI